MSIITQNAALQGLLAAHLPALAEHEGLTPEAIALIRNYSRSQLLEMAEKARSLAKPDAADAVAQLCTDIAK